jgi:hypothetical protein
MITLTVGQYDDMSTSRLKAPNVKVLRLSFGPMSGERHPTNAVPTWMQKSRVALPTDFYRQKTLRQ